MNNSTNLNIRIDKSVKDNSEKVLEDFIQHKWLN